ncbi:MAG TPA: winged helix-turn-helix domain-containing protein, partial [Bryobacteraceae bacterium]|nr:winged helix-turn-helix domain-containing protein [Bryobacteraceae bacterium]
MVNARRYETCGVELSGFRNIERMLQSAAEVPSVPSGNPRGTLARFGPFEFDPSSGELRKYGVKIKVHGQPVEILALLLAQPATTVTREELQRRLWPDNTFVDFESGLNAAVKRLRAALSDSPEKPKFVETLARRGYRFIAPVEMVENNGHFTQTVSNQLD